jgi:hypothetical protein
MSTQSDPGTETAKQYLTSLWSDAMSDDEAYLVKSGFTSKWCRRMRHRKNTTILDVDGSDTLPPEEETDGDGEGDVEVEGEGYGDTNDARCENFINRLMNYYPVAGEVWVHLLGHVNYLSSILESYPPPALGTPPVIVSTWRPHGALETSPYRITYGNQNPMMRGMIMTATTLIPHFSRTPHMAMSEPIMHTLISEYQPDTELMIVPAVNGRVVRMFQYNGCWYIANNQVVEQICKVHSKGGGCTGWLKQLMTTCINAHFKGGLEQFVRDLDKTRVWFFSLYVARQTLLFLGTCRYFTHDELRNSTQNMHVDLDFSLHRYLPPSVPLLPMGSMDMPVVDYLCNVYSLRYTGMYDGILIMNPVTMFAVRISPPIVLYLTPVMKHKQDFMEFLATRAVESQLTDLSRPIVDHVTCDWFKRSVNELTFSIFGERHQILLGKINWQIQTIMQWLPVWVSYVENLSREEWNLLDIDLQRLHSLLLYESHPLWHRIICNTKYSLWVAKLIVFCVKQWDGVPN